MPRRDDMDYHRWGLREQKCAGQAPGCAGGSLVPARSTYRGSGDTHIWVGLVTTRMPLAVLHSGNPHLPMTMDVASLTLAVGLLVVFAVLYDYLRQERSGDT